MNDIGPHIPAEGRRDNQASFGTDPCFADFEEAVQWHKVNRAAFGPLSEEGWRRMTQASVRRLDDGGLGLHYDPGLAVNQKQEPVRSVEMWDVWQRISCPVLTIWGTESKLLLAEDLERMQAEGPGTQVLPVEGVGHAPAIGGERVIGAIADFLGEA
jgi:pimeloyl-ACP methyl ester carboxylesterase